MTTIDWSGFDAEPEWFCHCQCGVIYESHVKLALDLGKRRMFARKPCPSCNLTENHLRRITSDLETVTIHAPGRAPEPKDET